MVRAQGGATSHAVDDTGAYHFTVYVADGIGNVVGTLAPNLLPVQQIQPTPGFSAVFLLDMRNITVAASVMLSGQTADFAASDTALVANIFDCSLQSLAFATEVASITAGTMLRIPQAVVVSSSFLLLEVTTTSLISSEETGSYVVMLVDESLHDALPI